MNGQELLNKIYELRQKFEKEPSETLIPIIVYYTNLLNRQKIANDMPTTDANKVENGLRTDLLNYYKK